MKGISAASNQCLSWVVDITHHKLSYDLHPNPPPSPEENQSTPELALMLPLFAFTERYSTIIALPRPSFHGPFILADLSIREAIDILWDNQLINQSCINEIIDQINHW